MDDGENEPNHLTSYDIGRCKARKATGVENKEDDREDTD